MEISIASSGIRTELVSEEDKGRYVLRKEIWYHSSNEDGTPMDVAYTKDGLYIGDPSNAEFLCDKRGINPEINQAGHSVCSIGKSDIDGKWYGWSHRAINGFAVGDVVKEGDCAYDPEIGAYTIETEEQAKQAAKAFAESVSSEFIKVSTSSGPLFLMSESKKLHKLKNPLLIQIHKLEDQLKKLRAKHKAQIKKKLQTKLQHLASPVKHKA